MKFKIFCFCCSIITAGIVTTAKSIAGVDDPKLEIICQGESGKCMVFVDGTYVPGHATIYVE
jgi:hypothetical protein